MVSCQTQFHCKKSDGRILYSSAAILNVYFADSIWPLENIHNKIGKNKNKTCDNKQNEKKIWCKKNQLRISRTTQSDTFMCRNVCCFGCVCIVHPNFKSKYSVVIWKSIQLYVTHRLLQQRFWKWKSYWKVL